MPSSLFKCREIFMKFDIFELSASVNNGLVPGAWVRELLGVILEVQDHKRGNFSSKIFLRMALKGLKNSFEDSNYTSSNVLSFTSSKHTR